MKVNYIILEHPLQPLNTIQRPTMVGTHIAETPDEILNICNDISKKEDIHKDLIKIIHCKNL